MLTEYELNNFKPFGKPAVIPIKPITLIFGANSSGKSSIIQSLLMLKQTLDESESSDVVLLPKGSLVDLGNFKEFIHRHEIKRQFSFKMKFSDSDLFEILTEIHKENLHNKDYLQDISDKLKNIIKIWIDGDQRPNTFSLSISFILSAKTSELKVEKINLFVDNDNKPFYTYSRDKTVDQEKTEYVFNPNFSHSYWKNYLSIYEKVDPDSIQKIIGDSFGEAFPDEQENVISIGYKTVLKAYKNIDFKYNNIDRLQKYLPYFQEHIIQSEDPLTNLITHCLGRLIKKYFEAIIYLPPLRDKAERYYISEIYKENTTDCLFSNYKFLESVNEMIARLGIDYKINILPLSKGNKQDISIYALRLLEKDSGVDVSFKDVGFGVCQILPVVINGMLHQNKNIIIEQPELHLHPALQAELGDMFIRSASGSQKNNFIIETHSEHLILRILRRIRETTEGKLTDEKLSIKPEDVAVIYVNKDANGAEAVHIPITPDGEFEIPWPKGFFPERAKELF